MKRQGKQEQLIQTAVTAVLAGQHVSIHASSKAEAQTILDEVTRRVQYAQDQVRMLSGGQLQ